MRTTAQTLINIKKVSLVFFLVTTTLHLTSAIFIANDLFTTKSITVNKTMDIPLLLTGLIYAFSSMRLSLTDPNRNYKALDISLISIIIIALVGLIIINLLIPNRFA